MSDEGLYIGFAGLEKFHQNNQMKEHESTHQTHEARWDNVFRENSNTLWPACISLVWPYDPMYFKVCDPIAMTLYEHDPMTAEALRYGALSGAEAPSSPTPTRTRPLAHSQRRSVAPDS